MKRPLLPSSWVARILLVDDSAIEFAVVRRILGNGTHWQLEWARTAEDALARLRAEPDLFDLVMLDLNMPGMDGFQMLEVMGNDASLVQLPVIVLTASSERGDQVRALTSGADEYLLKPLVPEIARVRVRSVLELSRHRRDLERIVQDRVVQMAHSDRLSSMGQLAAGMAHEINNPLTWISGNLQTLERIAPILREELERIPGWSPSARLGRILQEFPTIAEEMRGGVRRVARIVDGLKSFSRSGTGERSRVDLHAIVQSTRVLCDHFLKGIELDIQGPEGEVFVEVEAPEIEQVLVNLLTNAAYAVRKAERGSEGPAPWIGVGICHGEGRAFLSVRDNGTGIPPEVLSRLGSPFFTTKPTGEGTGLGISISQGIARSHGGELRPIPCEGGAFFLLDLPLDSSMPEAHP
jgi:two-component system NtrC family sensor kinase